MLGQVPALLPDLSPLRSSREFRLLWSGQLVSQIGSSVRFVALPYQVYLLTGSTFAVGLLGLFQAVPIIALSLVGGVIADRVDRRRMLLATNVGLALVSLALATATQVGIATLPLLYVLTAAGAGIGALDQPARSALAPSLVERRQIPAAMALTQTQWQLAAVVGPAIAGVLIAKLGLAAAYWVDVATFLGATLALLLMRTPAFDVTAVHARPLRALAEGIAFLWSRPLLLATMSVDFFATFFAVSRAVMPYFADRVFAVGPEGLGLLYAAPGVGATIVAFTSGWTNHVTRKGLGILVSVAQSADTVSTIFRHTILQLETPDALRGRLSAINLVFVAGGPYLGQFESGVVAELLTPELSVITGGLACVGVVVVTQGLVPQVARYRAELGAAGVAAS